MDSGSAFHKGLSEVADNFDAFIIDLWGVLHDGTHAYPGAINCLKELKAANKKIVLLSNAPRLSKKAEIVLQNLGFTHDLYDFVLTSGQVTHDYMRVTKNFGENRFYYIGPKKDEDILDGLQYTRVDDPKNATFVIVTGFDDFGDELETKLPEAQACLDAGIPMVCANPDRFVVKQDGRKMLCAGLIAEWYAHNGGRVQYFGKPYNDAYQECFELIELIDMSKAAAIGDSLHTDIAGANGHGIFSIFIAGGIHSEALGIEHGQTPEQEKFEKLCNDEGVFPNVVLPTFTW